MAFRNWLVMLKPNLPKRCFTTTLMDRLSQFSTSQDSMQICKHSTLRSQTHLYGLWVVDMLRQEFCLFTSHNTGCSVSVWKQMAITYKKASIVQKLPSRNSSFISYFIAFSAGYLVIYIYISLDAWGKTKSSLNRINTLRVCNLVALMLES